MAGFYFLLIFFLIFFLLSPCLHTSLSLYLVSPLFSSSFFISPLSSSSSFLSRYPSSLLLASLLKKNHSFCLTALFPPFSSFIACFRLSRFVCPPFFLFLICLPFLFFLFSTAFLSYFFSSLIFYLFLHFYISFF